MDNRQVNKMVQEALTSKPEAHITWVDFGTGSLTVAPRFTLNKDGKKKYVYLSLISDEMILDGCSVPYKMDENTKKLFNPYKRKIKIKKKARETRELLRDIWPMLVLCGAGITLGVALCMSSYEKNERQAKVQEYENSLPNYNDSIINAKTDADLQRFVAKQVQKEKLIERFTDSLKNASK